jgi:hypothetical protein
MSMHQKKQNIKWDKSQKPPVAFVSTKTNSALVVEGLVMEQIYYLP